MDIRPQKCWLAPWWDWQSFLWRARRLLNWVLSLSSWSVHVGSHSSGTPAPLLAHAPSSSPCLCSSIIQTLIQLSSFQGSRETYTWWSKFNFLNYYCFITGPLLLKTKARNQTLLFSGSLVNKSSSEAMKCLLPFKKGVWKCNRK